VRTVYRRIDRTQPQENANGHDVTPKPNNIERKFKVNASMILGTFLAILGIAAGCVTWWLFKANETTPASHIPKPIKNPVIAGDPDINLCLAGRCKQDAAKDGMVSGPMEQCTRFLEDNPACFPLFDENLGDDGIISIAGIASPAFIMSIPQWEKVFGI
jgi:hypothetical protein